MAKGDFSPIEKILSNPANKSKLKNYIDEAVICKQKIADENESIKNMAKEISEKISIDPKLFKQLVNMYFKNNFAEKQAEISSLDSAIELLLISADSD